MSPLDSWMVSEILQRARSLLDVKRYEELADEVDAAGRLPDEAARTQLRVALSKYPETREMVRRLASGEAEPMETRGLWLSQQDWRRFAGESDDDPQRD